MGQLLWTSASFGSPSTVSPPYPVFFYVSIRLQLSLRRNIHDPELAQYLHRVLLSQHKLHLARLFIDGQLCIAHFSFLPLFVAFTETKNIIDRCE